MCVGALLLIFSYESFPIDGQYWKIGCVRTFFNGFILWTVDSQTLAILQLKSTLFSFFFFFGPTQINIIHENRFGFFSIYLQYERSKLTRLIAYMKRRDCQNCFIKKNKRGKKNYTTATTLLRFMTSTDTLKNLSIFICVETKKKIKLICFSKREEKKNARNSVYQI